MKKMDKKAFTLIELIVVVAVVGILVLLGMPRFIGYKDKAELARIQHDVKVMEQEVGTVFVSNGDEFNSWEDNSKDLNQLAQENKLAEKEGIAEAPIGGSYKVIPEKYKDKINTKLKGTFYANKDGKVYYEHEKPLSGIPTEPEKPAEPGESEKPAEPGESEKPAEPGESEKPAEPGESENQGYSPEEEPGYSDEEIGDLIKEGVIPVATADELNSIRDTSTRTYGEGTEWEGLYRGGLNKKYVQVKDIDLSEYSEDGWNPIGTNGANFTGTYDGGNYVIKDLVVKGEGSHYQGLFGRTMGATIRNVGLIDNKVTGGSFVGGLVGYADNNSGNGTTIINSYATGSVKGSSEVGGLVGRTSTSTKISNSYATGSVEGSSEVGGLVGLVEDRTSINNSYTTGSVTGTGDYVGGLVGRIKTTRSFTIISNSYSTGSTTGKNRVGGLVGDSHGTLITIENSYATGSVDGTGSNVGGLVGRVWNSTIDNTYWNTETTGKASSAGGVGKTTTEMKNQATYTDWDFDTIWKIDEGKDYPKLR